ncbi:MAG: hypothetical protein QW520_02860 [Methanomassiliicoccales archaeon]
MLESFFLPSAAWLILGVVIAVLIFLNQKKNGEKGLLWPLLGFLLGLIGLLLWYLLVVRKRKTKATQYPARPSYGAPNYKFEKKEESATKTEQEAKKVVHQTEGAPRCPSCGAAISLHDLKCPGCGKALR